MKQLLFLGLSFFTLLTNAQSVAINTDGSAADDSALLDLKSNSQGVLVPRMTASQRGLIATPATGLLVYQTDAPAGFYFYNGSAWTSLSTVAQSGIDAIEAQNDSQNARLDNIENGVANLSDENDVQDTTFNNITAQIGTLNSKVLPGGGTANQVLAKVDGSDYNTQWITPAAGGSDNLGDHTATTNLNMNNQNIANAGTVNTKNLVVGLTNVSFNSNSVTSAILDANAIKNTVIRLTNTSGSGETVFHGMAAGVHGQIVYLAVNNTNHSFVNNSTTETTPTNRFTTTFYIGSSIPANTTTGGKVYTCIYDTSIGGGRWLIIGEQQ